jgi:hypothetical protein
LKPDDEPVRVMATAFLGEIIFVCLRVSMNSSFVYCVFESMTYFFLASCIHSRSLYPGGLSLNRSRGLHRPAHRS